jgi:hypothetical protein
MYKNTTKMSCDTKNEINHEGLFHPGEHFLWDLEAGFYVVPMSDVMA